MPGKTDTPAPGGRKRRSASGPLNFCVDRVPVLSASCWRAPFRITLGLLLTAALVVTGAEYLSGGIDEVLRLISGGFPSALVALLLLALSLTGLVLLLRGPDVVDCRFGPGGIHVEICLPHPTPVRLLARFRSPDLPPGEDGMVLIDAFDLPWTEIRSVRVFPARSGLHFRTRTREADIPCTAFFYDKACAAVRDRLGKKPKVRLSDALRDPAFLEKEEKARAAKKAKKAKKPRRSTGKARKKARSVPSSRGRAAGKRKAGASRRPAPRGTPSRGMRDISPEFLAEIQQMNREDEERARREDEKQRR